MPSVVVADVRRRQCSPRRTRSDRECRAVRPSLACVKRQLEIGRVARQPFLKRIRGCAITLEMIESTWISTFNMQIMAMKNREVEYTTFNNSESPTNHHSRMTQKAKHVDDIDYIYIYI